MNSWENPFWDKPEHEESRTQRILNGIKEHVKDLSKLLFVVMKCWNDNCVLYEFCPEKNTIISTWLSLEKDDKERHLKNGNVSLRSELNPAEEELFGCRIKIVEGNRYLVKINQPQLANRTFELVMDAKNNPAIIGNVGGIMCRVEYAFVQMKKGLIPEAEYMNFFAKSIADGNFIKEKIV